MRSNKSAHADPDKGNFMLALQHQKDCGVYKADVEKVENSIKDAMGYCTCDAYDGLRGAGG